MHTYFYLLLITNVWHSKSAKILAIAMVQSRSHFSIQQTFLQELATKGHEIITMSYFPTFTMNSTNYQEIMIQEDNTLPMVDSLSITEPNPFNEFFSFLFTSITTEYNICSIILRQDCIKNLIRKKTKPVDLIITETYFTKCYHLLAHKLNTPLIITIPQTTSAGVKNFLGSSFNPSFATDQNSVYSGEMTFFERLTNSLRYIIIYWYQFSMHTEKLNQIAKEVLEMEVPPDHELNSKLALAFHNNHFSFIPSPKVPTIIEIAGIHIKNPNPLPKDILEFIESAKHGVIFISFGTTINVNSIPKEKLHIFLKVFSTIPQKVLWRSNKLNIANLPSNVKIGKWFPQRDILEHENVVAFISHCGLFSTFEAIYTATPVLAIPFMFDQIQNAKILAKKGAAIYFDFETMNKQTFEKAIHEIANNERYRRDMNNLSKIFKDRPISPLNCAVYWIEYVIRHKGAGHLRTQAADMPLYKYLLLDVMAFVFGVIILVYYSVKMFVRLIM